MLQWLASLEFFVQFVSNDRSTNRQSRSSIICTWAPLFVHDDVVGTSQHQIRYTLFFMHFEQALSMVVRVAPDQRSRVVVPSLEIATVDLVEPSIAYDQKIDPAFRTPDSIPSVVNVYVRAFSDVISAVIFVAASGSRSRQSIILFFVLVPFLLRSVLQWHHMKYPHLMTWWAIRWFQQSQMQSFCCGCSCVGVFVSWDRLSDIREAGLT